GHHRIGRVARHQHVVERRARVLDRSLDRKVARAAHRHAVASQRRRRSALAGGHEVERAALVLGTPAPPVLRRLEGALHPLARNGLVHGQGPSGFECKDVSSPNTSRESNPDRVSRPSRSLRSRRGWRDGRGAPRREASTPAGSWPRPAVAGPRAPLPRSGRRRSCSRKIGRAMRGFAVHPYQPSPRRVYQPAAVSLRTNAGTWTRAASCSFLPGLVPLLSGPNPPDLCAACVPTQPNGTELPYPPRDNDGEKFLTQRASAALSEPE